MLRAACCVLCGRAFKVNSRSPRTLAAAAKRADRWSAQLQASRARRAASKARRRQEKHADLVAVRAGVGSCSSYMCRRCGFGPTQHDRCDDLVAHHGDRLDRHGRRRISNACQNCGWFSYNIRHWPRWDGRRLGCRARYRPLRHVRWLHTAALYVPNRIKGVYSSSTSP